MLSENSIEENSIEENSIAVVEENKAIKFYLNNINSTPVAKEIEILEDYSKELPEDLLIYGMEKAVENKARNLAYCKGIWNSWIQKGITTLSEAKDEKKPQPKNESLHKYYDPDNEVIDIRKYYDYLD